MKKTLFLSAILGAAMCCTAFAETINITGTANDIGKNVTYSADDTLVFNNTAGYFYTQYANLNIASTIQIGNGETNQTGMYISNGYGNKAVFTGALQGSGTIQKTGSGTDLEFNFAGDNTAFTGNVVLNAGRTFTLRFGGESVTATGTSGVGGTGSITFNSGNNTLIYQYGASEGGVTVANEIIKGTGTSKVQFLGGASYTLTKNATIDTLTIADDTTLTVGSGSTLGLIGGTAVIVSQPGEGENGYGSQYQTKDLSALASKLTVAEGGALALDGVAATLDEDGHLNTATVTNYVVNTTSATVDSEILANASSVVINQADTALGITGGVLDYADVAFGTGASLSSFTISDGGTLSVDFVTPDGKAFSKAEVTVNAGGTLLLKGHDSLGYSSGQVTPSITMQGSDEAKATLDIQDTGSLTLVTNLNLNGHTVVKNGQFNSYGSKLTVTGTDNEISSAVTVRNNFTVEVTGAQDTLLVTGNVDGGAVLSKTGEGAMTIQGSTLSGSVKLRNTGSGTLLLDGVTMGGRADLQGTVSVINGTTYTPTSAGFALVIGDNATETNVTLSSGEYNLGLGQTGVSGHATLTVAKDASLTTNLMKNSGTLTSNGTLAIQGDAEAKGSVTVNGETKIVTVNNAGTATFNGAFEATTVNALAGSTTTFNGATTIQTLTIAETAALAGNGAVTISSAITAHDNVDVTINTLTLSSGANVTLGEDHQGHLTSSALTVNGDVTVNANLVLADNGTMTFTSGSVTLGCTIDFGTGTTIALGEAYHDQLKTNGMALIFTGVDDVYGLENVVVTGDFVPGSLVKVQQQDGSFNIYATPEPATATLSLLALAGLMARRRRH